MADSDKDILITPNTGATTDPKIVFSSGATSGDPITLSTVDDGTTSTLSFEGSAGQLFSISNDMSGTIFSVGDVSGVPSIEADANGDVRIAEFGGNVQIGNSSGNVTVPSTLSVLGGSGGDLSVLGSIASTTSSSAFSVNDTAGKMYLVDDNEPAIYLNTTNLYHQWQLFNSYGNIGLVHYNSDPAISGSKNTQYLFYYTPTSNVDNAFLYFQVNGNEGMRITNTASTVPDVTMPGDLTVSGDVNSLSDARLKTDVKTLTNSLDKVKNLRGVSYIKNDKQGIGLIAQEVKEVLPEVVHEDKYYSVTYGNVVAVLIEAIKELEARVAQLEAK